MGNMMVFKQLIEDRYNECNSFDPSLYRSKIDFIGQEVFEFITYDDSMSEMFTVTMLDVLECILNGKNSEYHGKSDAHYQAYLLMVNMTFLSNKLNWGTSIRTAFFDSEAEHELIFATIRKGEFKQFIKELIEWSRG